MGWEGGSVRATEGGWHDRTGPRRPSGDAALAHQAGLRTVVAQAVQNPPQSTIRVPVAFTFRGLAVSRSHSCEMVLEGLLTNVLTERTAASVMHQVIADTESRPDRSRANR